MIDWEFIFSEWLEKRRKTAKENGFEYIVVRVEVPNKPELSVEVTSSFYHDDPRPFDTDQNRKVFKVDDGDLQPEFVGENE